MICLIRTHPKTRERPGWALPSSDTFVRDLEVQRVRPDRRIGKRRRNRTVVNESEFLHHQELTVPAGLEEGDSQAANLLDLDAAEPVDDVGLIRI